MQQRYYNTAVHAWLTTTVINSLSTSSTTVVRESSKIRSTLPCNPDQRCQGFGRTRIDKPKVPQAAPQLIIARTVMNNCSNYHESAYTKLLTAFGDVEGPKASDFYCRRQSDDHAVHFAGSAVWYMDCALGCDVEACYIIYSICF